MLLKPWYDVVTPREDLCTESSPQATEFVVPLDHVRAGQARDDYANPALFFSQTYLTETLRQLAAEVIRRLSGELNDTHAVFNLVAPTGEGKTHALTLFYHLATHGPDSHNWSGVSRLLTEARVSTIPSARTAVIVGTDFDSSQGHRDKRSEPLRRTLWGELAFQLGGESAFSTIVEYDQNLTAPPHEMLKTIIPDDIPCLLLLDEIEHYLERHHSEDIASQSVHFLANLVDHITQLQRVVLAISLPSRTNGSATSASHEAQHCRQMFECAGKTVVLSAARDTAEIVRRRLFTWHPDTLSAEGIVSLPDDALETCAIYGAWVKEHQLQLPEWFPFDQPDQAFAATYPFHPSVFAVFEQKWKTLPHFQGIRGILRILAFLLASAYQDGYSKVYSDPLIGLGTAPLDDREFRNAVLTQLGNEQRLETTIMTDICGRDAFALRLDAEAADDIKHNRLHLKAATAIFFESSGGITDLDPTEATESEILLAIGEPDLNLEDIGITLDGLISECYYLTREEKHYRFRPTPNLNKLFADRHPHIDDDLIDECLRTEISRTFTTVDFVIFFPEHSRDVPDQARFVLAVLAPDSPKRDPHTLDTMLDITRHHGDSPRTFQSAIIWVVADDETRLHEEAQNMLTWQALQHDLTTGGKSVSETTSTVEPLVMEAHITHRIATARKNLHDLIWRSYRHVAFLNKEHQIEFFDLGRPEPSSSGSLAFFILAQLRLFDYIVDSVSPRFLTRNWPAAVASSPWSTKAVRDIFFSSPGFPRLFNADLLKETIAKGASNGYFAYVGTPQENNYTPFYYKKPLMITDVEISDDMYLLPSKMAETYLVNLDRTLKTLTIDPPQVNIRAGEKITFTVRALDENGEEIKKAVHWESTGGTIDQNGVFTAGERDGSDFEVRANVGEQSAWVKVAILSKKPEPPASLVQHIQPPKAPPSVSTTPETTHLSWSGKLTAQQGITFVQNVLSPLHAEPGLTLSIHLDLVRETGITQSEIASIKKVLHQLGLPDTIITD